MTTEVYTKQQLQETIASILHKSNQFNAEYGITCGQHIGRKGYKIISFGKLKSLDAVIRIYSSNFFVLNWKTTIPTLAQKGSMKFDHPAMLVTFIANNL